MVLPFGPCVLLGPFDNHAVFVAPVDSIGLFGLDESLFQELSAPGFDTLPV